MRKLLSVLALFLACSAPALADFNCSIPLAASGTVGAGITVGVSLAAAAGKTTYITGFEVTTSNPVAAVSGQVSVFGMLGGTFNYTLTESVTAGAQMFIEYATPIPAAAINSSINVSVAAITGGGIVSLVAHGCQI